MAGSVGKVNPGHGSSPSNAGIRVNSPPIPICPRRGRPGRPRRRCHLRGQDRWTTTASASASPSPRPGAPSLRRRSDARFDGGAALCPVAAGLDLYPLPPRLSNLYSCGRAYVSDRDSNRAPFRRVTSRRRWRERKRRKEKGATPVARTERATALPHTHSP